MNPHPHKTLTPATWQWLQRLRAKGDQALPRNVHTICFGTVSKNFNRNRFDEFAADDLSRELATNLAFKAVPVRQISGKGRQVIYAEVGRIRSLDFDRDLNMHWGPDVLGSLVWWASDDATNFHVNVSTWIRTNRITGQEGEDLDTPRATTTELTKDELAAVVASVNEGRRPERPWLSSPNRV